MPSKHSQMVTWQELGRHCHYCGNPFDNRPALAKTIDHRQPLSRGGNNMRSNLVACCYVCNQTKGNMTEAEFLEWRRRGRPNKVAYLKEIGLLPGGELGTVIGQLRKLGATGDIEKA